MAKAVLDLGLYPNLNHEVTSVDNTDVAVCRCPEHIAECV